MGAVPRFIVLLILISQACLRGHLTQIYTDLLFIPRKKWQIRNISVPDIVFCHIQQPKIEILRNNFLKK